MIGPSCGLWPSRRGNLVAAAVDSEGFLVLTDSLPEERDEQGAWLSRARAHVGPNLQLVLPLFLARSHPLAREALELGFPLWLAPAHVTDSVSRAAWAHPGARLLAAMLARLPRVPALRRALRLAPRDPGPRQLRLF